MNLKSAPARLLAASALFATACAGLLLAGPLTPPAGPVTSTYKTLTEVEPRTAINLTNTPGDADGTPSLFKITQPGSYYLTGNITGVVGKHGIEITASGVTLDLNGFDLAGVPGMGAFDGVSVTVDSLRGITVVNGSVRNWGDGGVDLGFLSRGCRVEGVLASGNAGTGITTSISSTVTNCTSTFNGQRGIRASNASTISNCSVESNTGTGIEVNNGCTISGCAAYFNSAIGILTNVGCTVLDCTAYQNTGNGVQLGEGSAATRCSAMNNTGIGVSVGNGCTVADCTANFNALQGIRAFGGGNNNAVTISGCTAKSNTLVGISTNLGTVSHCTAYDNGTDGISVLVGTVEGCTAGANTRDGISCVGGCVIRGNSCWSNGSGGDGAGIHATNETNRIEDNNCTLADRGIEVNLGRNIIIRNTCSFNTIDWVIAANNSVGPILDRRATGSAAINGFSAPTNLNTTDPHANFSY